MRFKNYRNKHTNEDTIYSKKNIADMSVREAFSRKAEIMAQDEAIGIPSEGELQSSPNAIWVEAYTREDGTEVRGHWRSKPEGNSAEPENIKTTEDITEENKQGDLTGGASEVNSKQKNIIDTLTGMFNDYKSLEDPANTIWYVLGEFLTNYNNMKDADTHGADKYFHAKANYEAAQQGILGSAVAKLISDIREWSDSYRNINEKKYTLEESNKDINEDQAANDEGRRLGRENPTAPPYEILKHLMPNGFPKRYKKHW